MIHRIRIENFFSVAEAQEVIFDVPKNSPDLQCFIISRGIIDKKLPAVIGVFGANAAGKTTLLRSIVTLVQFIQHGFTLPVNAYIPGFTPYKRRDWWNKHSKVLVEFDAQLNENSPCCLFRYELHIAHSSDRIGTHVAHESLSYAPRGKFRSLFNREQQQIAFGRDFQISASDPRKKSVRTNCSVISALAQHNHPLSLFIMGYISTLVTNIIGYGKFQPGIDQVIAFYANNQNYLDSLNQEIRRLDVGLEKIKVTPTPQGNFIAVSEHSGLDGEIFITDESAGTRRFIELFPLLHSALETGSVAVIDEIDSDFHPQLIPEIFRWFYDSERNAKGAQLLFTAQNPALLDMLEKEQVYFAEKPTGSPTMFYGASEIKGLRREPSLMKKYLAGELGAIPHIG